MHEQVTARLAQCREQLQAVQEECAQVAQRQQYLVQQGLKLQGAIAVLEALVQTEGEVACPP